MPAAGVSWGACRVVTVGDIWGSAGEVTRGAAAILDTRGGASLTVAGCSCGVAWKTVQRLETYIQMTMTNGMIFHTQRLQEVS